MTRTEWRDEIFGVLCTWRRENIANLAAEFGVSVRIVKYDIKALIISDEEFAFVQTIMNNRVTRMVRNQNDWNGQSRSSGTARRCYADLSTAHCGHRWVGNYINQSKRLRAALSSDLSLLQWFCFRKRKRRTKHLFCA